MLRGDESWVPPEISFDIKVVSAVDGGVIARLTQGARTDLEREALRDARALDLNGIKEVWVIGDLPARSPFSADGLSFIEIDLQPAHELGVLPAPPDLREHYGETVRRFVSWSWGPVLGSRLTDAALELPAGPVASQPPGLPAEMQAEGWRACDLWLLTSVSPRSSPITVPWCLRGGRLLYSPAGTLLVWHPLHSARHWDISEANWLVHPLPECHRRHSYLSRIPQHGGVEHAARLIQDLLQHQDWTLWQLTQRVEAWERMFFESAGQPPFFQGFDADELAAPLNNIHEMLAAFRQVARDHERRARLNWLPSPDVEPLLPDIHTFADEVQHRAGHLQERIDSLNESLRGGWTLLANAAAGAAFESQKEELTLQQRLQNAVTLVTALVVVPSIVTGLYSTGLTTLPGESPHNHLSALAFIGVYSVFGSLATYLSLRRIEKGHIRQACAIVLLAVVVTIAITVVGLRG